MQTFTEACQQITEVFPTRESLLMFTLRHHAMNPKQTFDVTFFERQPLLEVGLDGEYASEFLDAHSFGPRRLSELLNIRFLDGSTASLDEIWSLNAMPSGGFDAETLAAVDLTEADETIGDQGETLREILNKTYRCGSPAELDFFCRRYLAS